MWLTLGLHPLSGPSRSVCLCVCLVASDIFTLKKNIYIYPSYLPRHPRAIKSLQGTKLAEMGHGNDDTGVCVWVTVLADIQRGWPLLCGWPP